MFKKVYLEISNRCNLQCSFCPAAARDDKIMSLAEFEAALKQVVPLTEIICLHLMGEPLAHPEFAQILGICDNYDAKIELTTNGLLIDKFKQSIADCKSVIQVNFSLQAFKDNFPDGDMAVYLSSIFEFVSFIEKLRPEVYVNLRLWNQADDSPDNEEIFRQIEKYFDVKINRTIQVEAIKSKNIRNRLYLHFDSRFEWPSFALAYQGTQGRCNGTVNHIGILADGTVVPCCLDKNKVIDLGNVKDNPLAEIIKTERFTAMQTGFSNGVLVEKLCQHCSFINRFKKNSKK